MQSTLFHYLVLWRPLGYAVVFFGMIFEGDAVLFTAAFLTAQGFFDLGDMLAIVLTGTTFGDTLWYLAGTLLTDSRLMRWAEKIVKPFDRHILERSTRTFFISKFMYGVHHATLLRAGGLHLPFRKFFVVDLCAILLWVAVIGGVGYLLNGSFGFLHRYLRFAEFFLLLAVVGFVAVNHNLAKLYKKEL